eukprot:TRINITY_DN6926_c2_g1_i1.p1 TRINITY_DN6926_c2_g1~~TRINITY_DN6926_c2_g1_i1.p1  ORF type:complete len:252 (+),score=52.41 TRINITY_DN6926_c2_g1_i1:67-822(+)
MRLVTATATIILLFVCDSSSQPTAAPLPSPTAKSCMGMRKMCRESVKVVQPNGMLADTPAWFEAEQTEGRERTKCESGKFDCFEGKDGCEKFTECIPDAVKCIQRTLATAYGKFVSPECSDFTQCILQDHENVCLANYGMSMYIPTNPVTDCDGPSICAMLAYAEVQDGCRVLPRRLCEQDGDCTWVEASNSCWDDPWWDRELWELIMMILAAVLLCCAIICCFLFLARYKKETQRVTFGQSEETSTSGVW